MAPFLTLTLRDSQIWGIRFDRWVPWNEKCPLFLTLDLVEDMIWGVILPFRPPRASNLGVCFTLPTTPSIEFGGHFHLSSSSEVKFGAHSCFTDLSDTQIWAHSCIIDLSGHQIWGSRSGGARGEESDFFPFSKTSTPSLSHQQKKLRACTAQSFHFF